MAGGELFEMNRRAAHPHMNNLVYGRRSAPSTASDPVVQPTLIRCWLLLLYIDFCVGATRQDEGQKVN